MIPKEAGMTISTSRIPKAAKEKLVPFNSRNVEAKTMRLAGIGTIICSRIHPKKTAKDALLTIKDSMLLIIVDNMGNQFNLEYSLFTLLSVQYLFSISS